jgi:uncharacterized protein (TIGR00369 family)
MSNASPGAELVTAFMEASPFVAHLGLRLESMEPERARVTMPFKEPLVTIGDTVHGGAISALVDTAATAASWSNHQASDNPRGTTVGLSVDFVAAARGQGVTADARVIRRGRSLCFCEVDVTDTDGRVVAKGLVTYKLD